MSLIKKILIIDDDPDDCFIFGQALKEIDETIEVRSLEECERAVAMIQEMKPDLIFLDINMPKQTGFDCLQTVRSHSELNRIPVVMFSSSSNPKEIVRSYRFGAHLYFQKPSSYQHLVQGIQKVLSFNWKTPDTVLSMHFDGEAYEAFEVR